MSPSTVLVVEDNLPIRELLTYTLEDAGFEVVAAQDGLQAIESMGGPTAPAAVVLDMMLPRLSGLAVLHHINARGYRVPVIAMSACSALLEEASANGAQAILEKPFNLDELVSLVASNCQERQ
jgi:DNA-binding response OmpR family regulator